MLQARRLWVRVPIRSLNVFNLPNPSRCIMALEFTQTNRNEYQKMFLGSKAKLACKADNLTPSVCWLSRKCGSLTSHIL
jgi:hypothetical protein